MSTVDMIKVTMEKQLKALQFSEFNSIFCGKVHDCLYNWIVDIEPAPESIIELIKKVNNLEGISSEHDFQNLFIITCLKGVARRSPEVLEGSWEKLLLLIVAYSEYFANYIHYEQGDIVPLKYLKEWIPKYCSLNLCPNPCLRLELFRLMGDFEIDGGVVFKETLIFTLCEVNDKYSRLEINDTRIFSASDLNDLIDTYSLNIGNILKSDYPKPKKDKIIISVVKIIKMIVVLEEQNMFRHRNASIVFSCFGFCGLISDDNPDDDLNWFADIVSNNSLLQEYVSEILRIITALSKNRNDTTDEISTILSTMIAAEARLLPLRLKSLPMYLCDRELKGITPPIMHQMLYFTNIKNIDYIEET